MAQDRYFPKEMNIGSVKSNVKITKKIYPILSGVPEIEKIESSCGCAVSQYVKKYGYLQLTYSSGPFSMYATGPVVQIRKVLTVYYKNGEKETIIINGLKLI